MNIWFILLYQPLVNALIFFYKILGENLGLAIIVLTLVIRFLLIPLTKPSLEAAKKMRELAPELEKLKKKFKDNKQALAQAQIELYKRKGVNPGAGCLPQVIQILILIALFQAFDQVLRSDGDVIDKLNAVLYAGLKLSKEGVMRTHFLYLDLTKPDFIQLPFQFKLSIISLDKLPGIFLIASAVTQFLSSKLMMPQTLGAAEKAKETPQQEDDLMAMMQKQMLFMMPLMTLIIGFRFPSGIVLYWLTFSLFMLIQQIVIKDSLVSQKEKTKKIKWLK